MSLTDHQKNQLLDAVAHYMDMELRGKIMRELPLAYNAWVGHEIMRVENVTSIIDPDYGEGDTSTEEDAAFQAKNADLDEDIFERTPHVRSFEHKRANPNDVCKHCGYDAQEHDELNRCPNNDDDADYNRKNMVWFED